MIRLFQTCFKLISNIYISNGYLTCTWCDLKESMFGHRKCPRLSLGSIPVPLALEASALTTQLLHYLKYSSDNVFFCPVMRLGCVLKSWHKVCVSATFLACNIVSAYQITEQSVSLKRLIYICALRRYKRFLETLFTVSANELALSKRFFRFGQSFDRFAPFVC